MKAQYAKKDLPLEGLYHSLQKYPFGSLNGEQVLHKSAQKVVYGVVCENCNGDGYLACFNCNNSGCTQCEGRGKKRCLSCKSDGEILYIGEIQITTTPTYHCNYVAKRRLAPEIRSIIDKIEESRIAQLCQGEFKKGRIITAENRVELSYSLQLPFGLYKSDIGRDEIKWIFLGSEPHLINDKEVMQKLAKRSLLLLNKKSSFLRVLNPFIASNSRKRLDYFLSNKSHQEILIGNSRGLNGKELEEYLFNSLSGDYIEATLKSINRLMRSILFWSIIKRIFFLFIISYLVIGISVLFGYLPPEITAATTLDHLKTYYSVMDNYPLNFSTLFMIAKGYTLLALPFIVFAAWFGERRGVKWIKRNGGAPLLAWCEEKRMIRKGRWLIYTVVVAMAFTVLLYYFPIDARSFSPLFNIVPLDTILNGIETFKLFWISLYQKIF